MVIFDANFLLFLLQDNLPAPNNPETGKVVTECEARINHLAESLQKNKEKIIIPTPVLAEALVRADGAAPAYISKINKSSALKIEPFDTRAAVEVSLLTAEALKSGDKKSGSTATWAKVKFDRQIIGIALANRITTIYANDQDLKKLAEKKGITVIGVHELEVPEKPPATLFDWENDNNENTEEETGD
ncbi:MAG: hypothetical protein OEY94_07930 [Alphaproteobacteria bacterium]|nr:hypothetical protein [Alphaproteobacteria bacterium]